MSRTGDGQFETLSQEECWELFSLRTVGRIAFVDADGVQQLLPVNHAVRDGVVYLRTARDSVLGELASGHDAVALQADHVEDLFQLAWSVTVTGTVGEVHDADVVEQLVEAGRPAPWAPGERDVFLALTPGRIAGRRVKQA